MSQHGDANLARLTDDFAAGNALLDELAADKITYLEGNHETRLSRFLSPSLSAALSIVGGLRLRERGIEYIAEGEQPIKRGNLFALHGHQIFPRMIPKYHAPKVADTYGKMGSHIVYGHAHRPQSYSRIAAEPATATSSACLRTRDPAWLHGQRAGWEHGIVTARIKKGIAHVRAIPIIDGRFF